MNIKDYLHLHIGCKMMTRFGSHKEIRTLSCVVGDKAIYDCDDVDEVDRAPSWDMNYQEEPDKPILRTYQSITQEEWDNAPNSSLHIGVGGCFYSPELFVYLLKLGIDIFGLIDAGLAIDKTKV